MMLAISLSVGVQVLKWFGVTTQPPQFTLVLTLALTVPVLMMVVSGWGVAASFCLPLSVVGTPGLHTL